MSDSTDKTEVTLPDTMVQVHSDLYDEERRLAITLDFTIPLDEVHVIQTIRERATKGPQ